MRTAAIGTLALAALHLISCATGSKAGGPVAEKLAAEPPPPAMVEYPPPSAPPTFVAQSGPSANITGLFPSPDGRFVMATTLEGLELWSLDGLVKVARFAPPSLSGAYGFAAGTRNFLYASGDSLLALDIAKGSSAHVGGIRQAGSPPPIAAVSADGASSIRVAPRVGFDGSLVLDGPDASLAASLRVDMKRLRAYEEKLRGWGHELIISAPRFAYSPDGRYLAAFPLKDPVLLLDRVSKGKALALPGPGHARVQEGGVFSADSRVLAIYGQELGARSSPYFIEFYSTATWRRIGPAKPIREENYKVALSPDGSLVAVCSGGGVALYESRTGRLRVRIEPYKGTRDERATAWAFGPDGAELIAAFGLRLGVYSTATGEPMRKPAGGRSLRPLAAAYSWDGRRLLAACEDGSIRILESGTGRQTGTFLDHRSDPDFGGADASRPYAAYIACSPSGLVASCFLNQDQYNAGSAPIRLWSIGGGPSEIFPFKGRIHSLQLTPDGQRLLIASGGFLYSYDLASGRRLASATIPDSHSSVICFEGTIRVENDLELRVYDDGLRLLRTQGAGAVGKVRAISPDSRFVLDWKILSAPPGFPLAGTPLFVPPSRAQTALWPLGARYACIQDRSLAILDAESGKSIVALFFFEGEEWLTSCPDGFFVASQGGARLMTVVSGLEARPLDRYYESLFRPDIVAERIQGLVTGALAAGKAPTASPPPDIRLEAERVDGRFRGLAVVPAEAPFRIAGGALRLRAVATDRGGGIAAVRVYHEGKELGEIVPEKAFPGEMGKSRELVLEAGLIDGLNHFRAVALSAAGVESAPAEIEVRWAAAKTTKPRLWLLTVALNRYRNPAYDLRHAREDAEGFAESLKASAGRLFGRIEERTLVDGDATRAGLVAAMEDVSASAAPEDVFVFFYAGHGIALDGGAAGPGEFAFILYGVTQMTDPAIAEAEGLTGSRFRSLVASVRARKQLLVLDACNAGALRRDLATRGAAEEIALSRLSRAAGSVLVAACQPEQSAVEFGKLGHGAFTKVLMDGLAGAAADDSGQITASGLKSYVERSLPPLALAYAGVEQWPTGFVDGQDFPLGLR